MVEYKKFILNNGLTVIMHREPLATTVSVNVVYKVGSRHEEKQKTGLAHLFEHLMFEGSQYNGEHFDEILQRAGGENNAYTNADLTSYYDIVPAHNLELALYLEAGRMSDLSLTDQNIETQRSVVIEEFKETCLNVPYGDAWHHILDLSYTGHSYSWPVIGRSIDQLKEISTQDFRSFYDKHYTPDNAILSIAGQIDYDQTADLVHKWFDDKRPGKIKNEKGRESSLPVASGQDKSYHKKVPIDSIWLTFNMCERNNPDYYSIDLISDILGTGKSSRLYESLVKQKQLALSADAYLTGTIGPGLLVIEAKPAAGISLDQLEAMIWQELGILKNNGCTQLELNKYIHRIENGIQFSEIDSLHKAMHLAYFEVLGDIDQINREINNYNKTTPSNIIASAQNLLIKANSNTVRYRSREK